MSKSSTLALIGAVALAGLFPTSGIASDFLTEGERGTARSFTGEGQPMLIIDGCKGVERVFVGGAEIPPYVSHQVPMDADGKVLKEVEYPLYTIAKAETGETVLLRANLSNDGIWQEGVEITVVGQWDELPEVTAQNPGPTEPADTKGDKKS